MVNYRGYHEYDHIEELILTKQLALAWSLSFTVSRIEVICTDKLGSESPPPHHP